MPIPRVLAGVLVAALCIPAGCRRDVARPNILLLSVDTLRADHLGSYGYPRDTSPHLDDLARRSVRFARAFAPAPWTLPSHVAMLTGRHATRSSSGTARTRPSRSRRRTGS